MEWSENERRELRQILGASVMKKFREELQELLEAKMEATAVAPLGNEELVRRACAMRGEVIALKIVCQMWDARKETTDGE